jgi:ferric iron reductase protein FhuF
VISVYQHSLKSVEELLTFIEHHFARYFNIDEKIPNSYKLLMQTEFAQSFNALLKRYRLTNIDADLLEIIMVPFHRFLSNHENKQLTYRELLYLKILLKELD